MAPTLTEPDVSSAIAWLERMLRELELRHERQLERVRSLGGHASVDPSNPYWPTTAALYDRRERHARLLHATKMVIANLRGRPPLPGTEWGKTGEIVSRALKHGGWRPELPDTERAHLDRDVCKGTACPHCGHEGMMHQSYTRGAKSQQEYRGFASCQLCGLTREL